MAKVEEVNAITTTKIINFFVFIQQITFLVTPSTTVQNLHLSIILQPFQPFTETEIACHYFRLRLKSSSQTFSTLS